MKKQQDTYFKVTKTEAKKDLKNALMCYLADKNQLMSFQKDWIRTIILLNIFDQIYNDFKVLKEKYQANLQVSALMRTYIFKHGQLMLQNGKDFNSRCVFSSKQYFLMTKILESDCEDH
jgi:hypothetical protein